MNDIEKQHPSANNPLFDCIVSILEQARGNVVRTVNSNMVLAYWLIGGEIVQELQGGEERAGYGKQVVENLSNQLTERYGAGFSKRNLQSFKQLYLAYSERDTIVRPVGAESSLCFPAGSKFGFSPQLTWSHYRTLMRVDNVEVRDFYEREAIECGWSKAQLERQILSHYHDRIIANHGKQGLLPEGRERLPGERVDPASIIKSPFVLEFLGLPDSPEQRESKLEQAIIDNLQAFLLELGKGFSFVARQKHVRFDDEDFYVDLVFYNYLLKCFLLIDLKIGKLTHADVGQMDGYVRLYEDQFKVPGDNPTIGLILCSDKSEAVAKYSVLNEGRQIFTAKYLQFLPSEEQLKLEIERERKLIEATFAECR